MGKAFGCLDKVMEVAEMWAEPNRRLVSCDGARMSGRGPRFGPICVSEVKSAGQGPLYYDPVERVSEVFPLLAAETSIGLLAVPC